MSRHYNLWAMPMWDNTRFDAEAKKIAQTWFGSREANGASLTELVTKTARDASLNPEQIERLARITNGHAFNSIFDAAKVAKQQDRYPDFDVADAKSVIAALYQSAAQPETKTASYRPLPDQFEAVRARPDPLAARNEKVAEARMVEDIEAAVRGPTLMTQFHNLKAACEQLKSRMLGSEARWWDALGAISKVASNRDWSRDDFECDALALLGADALPELNLLRKSAGDPALAPSAEKVAAFQDRHIGTESAATRLLKTAIDHRKDYVRWKAAHATAVEKFEAVKAKVYAAAE